MWITPPENAGQVVEVSYATDPDGGLAWQRRHDRSDGTFTYRCVELQAIEDDDWRPWDVIPSADWRETDDVPSWERQAKRAAARAIRRSVETTAIVTLQSSPGLLDALVVECDGYAESGDVTEYWGTDANGDEWRVHVDGGKS